MKTPTHRRTIPAVAGTFEIVRGERPLELDAGGVVVEYAIGFERLGDPESPAVAVLGGISADAHLAAHRGEPRPGWWDALVGPGRPLDTNRYQPVSIDWLGGTGATRATVTRRATVDRGTGTAIEEGRGVPPVTPRDQAMLLAAALDHVGIDRLYAIIGASYGGMVALCFGAEFPDRVGRALVISAAHETHPMATALRSIQREVVRLGVRTGRARSGLDLARRLAMTTYRTAGEFRTRFSNAVEWEGDAARFPVEGYLRHHGRRFSERFTAERFLRLSESLDLHRVDPDRIRPPVTLVSVEEDALVPPWQMDRLRAWLGDGHRLVRIRSRYGHDAFLKEHDAIGAVLRETLAADAPAAVEAVR